MAKKLLVISECYTCGTEYSTRGERPAEWVCPTCEAKPKLERHYSLEHADKVLGLVVDAVEDDAPHDWSGTIGVWSNGREQGYSLTSYDGDIQTRPQVVFAQQRSSDTIVVVWGPARQFNITTNHPNEKVWEENNRTFRSDIRAAEFITRRLLRKPLEKGE